jgi:hypothetical protein
MPTPSGHSRNALIAEASAAGLFFLIGPGVGYFIGKWIGVPLGLGKVPAWALATLGLVAAFVNLIRLTGRASR